MQVGFIGTGLMGAPMAARLVEVGHSVTAYNRTASKLEPLRELGVEIASSPTQVIQAADVIILMLTNAAAIQELLTPTASALSGRTLIQMGTIAPAESKAIHGQVQTASGTYLEAPVLGSIPESKAGTLLVMAGAAPQDFETQLPLLKVFGPDPLLVGPVGTAAALKLALNQLIGGLTTAFATSLSFCQTYGVEVETFMQILRNSALYAPTFDKKLTRMLDQNFENPNFPTKHLLKDMTLFQQAAQAEGLPTENTEAIQTIIQRAMVQFAEADYSALYTAVQKAEPNG
ncbi:NAD(P)-dependent oxidoreductase [Acaryochloris sp. CCMEE 5410]|uniref:NAD(P)-dependent oxidoreductase n=1 Tax=Acaryochloris sp. CCMEE 5410 TaxID=310037 RepID=UPI0002484C1C|nr:NAD(P)-dependent oxidoreductase [Acaryochloris sp. CCMEE 5410]KAI9132879.1 NAD(P)-dependent oxidoreductase [Acaryochloris sp. CCMEE 5410]